MITGLDAPGRRILFSENNIPPLLAERDAPGSGKSMTRRLLEPQEIREGEPGVCRYGKAGDLLWVPERFALSAIDGLPAGVDDVYAFDPRHDPIPSERTSDLSIFYWSDDNDPDPSAYYPAELMPRWASRLTLRITDVSLERLCDISEADAHREGYRHEAPRDAFLSGPWASRHRAQNPWVWVISFDVIAGNIDAVMKNDARVHFSESSR